MILFNLLLSIKFSISNIIFKRLLLFDEKKRKIGVSYIRVIISINWGYLYVQKYFEEEGR